MEADWPTDAWAGALGALSAAWRAGRMPGWLFNGARARHAPLIARLGMRATEGAASARLGGAIVATELVHLATPEIAAWYMRDLAVEAAARPCLVAVDVAGWMAARGDGGPVPLVDENSVAFPTFSALGARSAAEVRARLVEGYGWEHAFAVTGALAFAERTVPPAHLVVVAEPTEMPAVLRRAAGCDPAHPFALALAHAAATHPWKRSGAREGIVRAP